MLITYTAIRSLTDDHIVGGEYSFDVKLTSFDESRTAKRNQDATLDGTVHTLTHHIASNITITTQILKGSANLQMTEFLHSVEFGKTFQITNPDTGLTQSAILKSFKPTRSFKQLNEFRYTLQVIIQ